MVKMKFVIEVRGSDDAVRELALALDALCAKTTPPVRAGGFGYNGGSAAFFAEFAPCDPFEAVAVARDLRGRIERAAAWAGAEPVCIALAR